MQLLRALQMSVTPKAHACESHAIAQMEEEGGLGDYDEDFVERWHQEGKRNDVRTRAMRERAKRFISISKWEQMNRNPEVVSIQQNIKQEFKLAEETKQKRKATRDDNPRATKKNMTHVQREKARMEAVKAFTAPNEQIPTADQENYLEYTTNMH
jgi:hypothetical protein